MAKQSVADILGTLKLDEIRAEIAVKQADLDALVADRQRDIDALRVLEKALDIRANGKPARKKPVRRTKPGPTAANPMRTAIADANEAVKAKILNYLDVAGPSKPRQIATQLDLPLGVVTKMLGNETSRIGFDAVNGSYCLKR